MGSSVGTVVPSDLTTSTRRKPSVTPRCCTSIYVDEAGWPSLRSSVLLASLHSIQLGSSVTATLAYFTSRRGPGQDAVLKAWHLACLPRGNAVVLAGEVCCSTPSTPHRMVRTKSTSTRLSIMKRLRLSTFCEFCYPCLRVFATKD